MRLHERNRQFKKSRAPSSASLTPEALPRTTSPLCASALGPRSLERLDVAGALALAGPSDGPPGPPAPPLRHDLAGSALAVALTDDGPPRWWRGPRARPPPRPPLPAPAAPAQLPGPGDATHRPRPSTAAHAQQALDAPAEGAGQHQFPAAERLADARAARRTGGPASAAAPAAASTEPGCPGERALLAGACGRAHGGAASLPAQLRTGRGHGQGRPDAAQPRAQRVQAAGEPAVTRGVEIRWVIFVCIDN